MQSDGAYAYAKACGIIGKSFIGKRLSALNGLHSLGELERLVFPDMSAASRSGRHVLGDFEKKVIQRAVDQILSIIDSYSKPPEILIRLLYAYEYSDLKTSFHSAIAGKKEIPPVCDIGRFSKIPFRFFPDIPAMLKNTEFDYLISDYKQVCSGNMDIKQIDIKIDSHYYNALAKSMINLSPENNMIVRRILGDEISLRNCILALRLRTFYEKTPLETKDFLMDIDISRRSLATEAFASLKLPLDSRGAWNGWKWEKFLNPEDSSVHWKASPRYFQNAASKYLYRLTLSYFHGMPMEISSIFCFVKLKQIEEDFLTSVAEGLAFGMDSNSVLRMLEEDL